MKRLLIGLIFLSTSVVQAEVEFIWGMRKELDEYDKIAKEFKRDVEKLTQNEVKIKLKKYDNDPTNPLKEIENGNAQIYQVPTSLLKMFVPAASSQWLQAWEVPFIFKNKKHVESYISSPHTSRRLSSLETEKLLPLTYSYAGGFVGVLSKTETDNINLKNLNFCPVFGFEPNDIDSKDVDALMSNMPCKILLYDLGDLTHLDKKSKEKFKVNLTKHHVFSRITMISKEHLSQIPEEYRDDFIKRLRKLLDKERHSVYSLAEKNLRVINEDKDLKVQHWKDKSREVAGQDYNSASRILKKEIDFIKSLPAH